MGDLYYTKTFDLLDLSEAEIEAVLRENSHESFVRLCAEMAGRELERAGILEAVGWGTRTAIEARGRQVPPVEQVPNLLLKATADDPFLNACAHVFYHFARRAAALRDGRIDDVSNHAMRLGYAVAQAMHIEAWGDPVLKHRNITGRPEIYDVARVQAIADAHRMPNGAIAAAGWEELKRVLGISRRQAERILHK